MGQSATRALRRGSEEISSLEELARLAEEAAAPAIAEESQQFAERVTW